MVDTETTKEWVDRYIDLGLCPLPSRGDLKAPQLSEYRGVYNLEPVPEWVYIKWSAPNIQLVTGTLSPAPIKIIVVDCDGERAISAWQKICAANSWLSSPSWSARTGGGGLHFYFRLPSCVRSVETGLIWGLWDTWGQAGSGGWAKHEEIKILGDRALAVAPPSIHPTTGKRYAYVGLDTPAQVDLPEIAPKWLLEFPRLSVLNSREALTPVDGVVLHRQSAGQLNRYERNFVLSCIRDKPAVARSWGLDFASRMKSTGWLSCYVPGKETRGQSRTPSGSFHAESGVLRDHSLGETMSLFDVGVALGVFDTWIDALRWCGNQFC